MKRFLAIALLMAVGTVVYAQHATLLDIKGKVEVQLPGKAWTEAKNGTKLPPGSMVSTGFKSTASLAVMGGEALISLKPLTRLALEELIKSATGSTTSVKLVSGKVKAEVRPGTPENTQTFEVKGPNATASVRGTGIDTDGESIVVNHGSVDFVNNYGIGRSVIGGEFTTTGGGPSVSPPVAVKPATAPAAIPTGQAEEDAAEEETDEPSSGDTAAPEPGLEAEPELDLDTIADTFGDQMVLTGSSDKPSFEDVLQDVVSAVIDEQLSVLTADLTVIIE